MTRQIEQMVRSALMESGGLDRALTLLADFAGLEGAEALQMVYSLSKEEDDDTEYAEKYLTNMPFLYYT